VTTCLCKIKEPVSSFYPIGVARLLEKGRCVKMEMVRKLEKIGMPSPD
jgi:hypothetical protein